MKKKFLLFGLLLLVLVGLPLTVIFFQNKTNVDTKASEGTTLSLTPATVSNKSIGQTFSLDLVVNPGIQNAVTGIRFQLKYDPSKLQPAAGSEFVPVNNAKTSITVIEGPIVNAANGTISEVLTTGLDTTKAIRDATKAGTFNFKAIGGTGQTPTKITFTSETKVFSAGTSDQAGEDVLSSTKEAYVSIIGESQNPENPPATLPPPENEPPATINPTITLTPQANSSEEAQLNITMLLHGIGNSGDNANPTASSLSNKNPLRQNRSVSVTLINSSGQIAANKIGTLNYSSTSGNFTGTVPVGTNLTEGDYIVKIKTESFLQKRMQGFIHLLQSSSVSLTPMTLVAGDANSDNHINILDYNLLLGCYSDFKPAVACDENKKLFTDFNDDGDVNQIDLNLFLREITVQNGD